MKQALVIGSAPGVFDDLKAAPAWPKIVVNWAGVRELGPIEFWASLHPLLMIEMIGQRERKHGDMNFTAYVKMPRQNQKPPRRKPVVLHPLMQPAPATDTGNGSSALLAVMVALHLGYERLLLCGVPLEGAYTLQGKGPELRGRPNAPMFEMFRKAWTNQRLRLAPHVRSMSGWTRGLFGGPEEWL